MKIFFIWNIIVINFNPGYGLFSLLVRIKNYRFRILFKAALDQLNSSDLAVIRLSE